MSQKVREQFSEVAESLRTALPSWQLLKRFQNRPLVHSSAWITLGIPIFVSAIGIVERAVPEAETVIRSVLDIVPGELFVAFLISSLFATGTLVFRLFCPNLVYEHVDLDEFISSYVAKATRFTDIRTLPSGLGDEVVERLARAQRERDNLWAKVEAAVDEEFEGQQQPEIIWDGWNYAHIWARLVCTALFSTGSILAFIFLFWTVPKEVFEVYGVGRLIDYLF